MTEAERKKLARRAALEKDPNAIVALELERVDFAIDETNQKLDEVQTGCEQIVQAVNFLDQTKADKEDVAQQIENIARIPGRPGNQGPVGPIGPVGPKGDKGDTTIVDRVIVEKTEIVKEQPIIKTEIVKETTIKEDLAGEAIVNKINDLPLTDDKKIDASHIKNLTKTISGSYPVGVSETRVKALIAETPAGASTYSSLTDVNMTGLADGNVPLWDETTGKWIPGVATDTDEKVKLNASDPTAGYLDDKVATYGFLDDASAFATSAQGLLADTALQSESDPLSLHLTDIATTDLSDFNNDLGNYGGWITDISGQDLSTADNATSQFITLGDVPAETDPLSLHLDQTTGQALTNVTDVTITATDEIYYGDVTDTNKIKKDTVQGILDLVPAPDLSGVLALDQTTPQTVTGGAPIFQGGIKAQKRVVQNFGSDISITPTSDTADIYEFSTDAVAGTLTVNAPTGTPNDGQGLLLRIKTTNAQTFSWNGIYRQGTSILLPSSSSGSSLTDYVAFIWNSADSKWDLTGLTTGY